MILRMMMSIDRKRRTQIKQAVLRAIDPVYGYLSLPVPVKHIAKSHKHIKLIKYSAFMTLHGLTYTEMLSFADTCDAFTDYQATTNRYLLCYNDKDDVIIHSNRYRWNIAHELGHIFLKHHQEHPETRLLRNSLGEQEYTKLEEADLFAAYLLVPHSVLLMYSVSDQHQMASLCEISGRAAGYRLSDFTRWKRRKKSEIYDYQILNAFSYYIDESIRLSIIREQKYIDWINDHHICPICKTFHGDNKYPFCPICGLENVLFHWGIRRTSMVYQGIELDHAGKALKCPICENEKHFKEGDHCIICGSILINRCTFCNHDEPLPGNSRFCPYCGHETTFLQKNILLPWDFEQEQSNLSEEIPF